MFQFVQRRQSDCEQTMDALADLSERVCVEPAVNYEQSRQKVILFGKDSEDLRWARSRQQVILHRPRSRQEVILHRAMSRQQVILHRTRSRQEVILHQAHKQTGSDSAPGYEQTGSDSAPGYSRQHVILQRVMSS